MATDVGRRKQLKPQQLQPVAAAAKIATADKTNSFLMIGLLRKNASGRAVSVGANGSIGPSVANRRQAVMDHVTSPAVWRYGRWAEQLYTTVGVVQTQRAVFSNKVVARTPRRAFERRGSPLDVSPEI